MKILIALLAIAASGLASTHIVDTNVVGGDGRTPIAFGRFVVQGYQRDANGKSALKTKFTVPIVNGAVDFTVEGGTNVYFNAKVYITTSNDPKAVVLDSYDEPVWVVPDTASVLKITDIRGAAIPANLYLKSGTYCITVSPPAWQVVSITVCGGGSGGALFDTYSGLFDSASGLFDAH